MKPKTIELKNLNIFWNEEAKQIGKKKQPYKNAWNFAVNMLA